MCTCAYPCMQLLYLSFILINLIHLLLLVFFSLLCAFFSFCVFFFLSFFFISFLLYSLTPYIPFIFIVRSFLPFRFFLILYSGSRNISLSLAEINLFFPGILVIQGSCTLSLSLPPSFLSLPYLYWPILPSPCCSTLPSLRHIHYLAVSSIASLPCRLFAASRCHLFIAVTSLPSLPSLAPLQCPTLLCIPCPTLPTPANPFIITIISLTLTPIPYLLPYSAPLQCYTLVSLPCHTLPSPAPPTIISTTRIHTHTLLIAYPTVFSVSYPPPSPPFRPPLPSCHPSGLALHNLPSLPPPLPATLDFIPS